VKTVAKTQIFCENLHENETFCENFREHENFSWKLSQKQKFSQNEISHKFAHFRLIFAFSAKWKNVFLSTLGLARESGP
jgi:hypothetical protein